MRPKPFDVYYNLHKKLFSIKDRKTGRVVDHKTLVQMRDVDFIVLESGRQRVLKEKRKNVHAYVRGYLGGGSHNEDVMVELTYNPYKYSAFVNKETEEPVTKADRVLLMDKRIFAIIDYDDTHEWEPEW